jgi:hypothetical protein
VRDLAFAFLHIVISLFSVRNIDLEEFYNSLYQTYAISSMPQNVLTTYISPKVMASDFLPEGTLLSILIIDWLNFYWFETIIGDRRFVDDLRP